MKEELLVAIGTRGNVPMGLFFTSNRLIIARTGSTAARIASYGFGWGGQAVGEAAEDKKLKELSKVSPESILTDNKNNFAIPYSDIIQVEMFKKMLSGRQIRINMGTKKQQFRLSNPRKYKEYADILKSVLGDKLVVS